MNNDYSDSVSDEVTPEKRAAQKSQTIAELIEKAEPMHAVKEVSNQMDIEGSDDEFSNGTAGKLASTQVMVKVKQIQKPKDETLKLSQTEKQDVFMTPNTKGKAASKFF